MSDHTSIPWWDRPVPVTRGQIVLAAIMWLALDFIKITVMHFL